MNSQNTDHMPPEPNDARTAASHRHLTLNASDYDQRNIIIRVDSLNADRSVAFCTVQQREHGWLRRTYSHAELVWHAEQALAPLNGMGILPLINVHAQAGHDAAINTHRAWSPFTWITWLRGRLGYPLDQEGFDGPDGSPDPFGLRRAMLVPRLIRSKP